MKLILLLIPFLLVIAGCSEPVPPKFLDEGETYRKYGIHYEYQAEEWNDQDVLSTPRLQFTWVKPGDEKDQVGVWSMKFDGTDLREVVKPEELMPDHLGKGYLRGEVPMVRSPNNRYIPYAVSYGIYYERRIIDLKTREVTVIVSSGGPPGFQWFKGSRFLKFSGPGPLMQYDIETKKMSNIAERFTTGYLEKAQSFDHGNQLVDMNGPHATFYDYDSGELLNKIDNTHGILTMDNKHWLKWESGFNVDITPLNDAYRVFCRLPEGMSRGNLVGISADGDIFSGRGSIKKAKCGDDKRITYSLPGEGRIGGLVIYNAFPKPVSN